MSPALEVPVSPALQVSGAGAVVFTYTADAPFLDAASAAVAVVAGLLWLRNLLDMDAHLGLDQHLLVRIYTYG